MDNLAIIIITYIIVILLLVFIVYTILKNKRNKNLKEEIESLDREKNEIESAPVISELAKLETIIKNEKMEERYKTWFNTFDKVRTEDIPKINDMIIDLDMSSKKNYKEFTIEIAKVELAIYKAKTATDKLLDEIREVNLSSEKYRNIITKLKSKYRELQSEFNEKKDEYDDIGNVIELQFENIEKRFQDFEDNMEANDYDEVFHIVKGIDIMIDHMGIVIKEVPDLVLLANKLIPKKIEQITEVYDEMKKEKYPLKHLKIEYNVEESLKNVNSIIDRIKVLNLENCMFELKTMLEYLESLFEEFELEKKSKKEYEDNKVIFESRFGKLNGVIDDIYGQLDDIKNMYDLTDSDIDTLNKVNEKKEQIKKNYDELLKKLDKKKVPYSKVNSEVGSLLLNVTSVEDELDASLKNLGNMYEDEVRAREQLDEIQELLKQSKGKIRSYKLPIISNNYFVELSEANDAILEIIKELERKPIMIKTLNIRVDTARDLVLKLYNTTTEMVNMAKTSELLIVYGNRYRCENINVDADLTRAEMYFYKGNYKKSLEVATSAIERVDGSIKERLNDLYEKR